VSSDNFPDDIETLKAMLLAERYESERLRQIIKELQRHRFGRRAETLPEEQMLLGLEDVEQVAASGEASEEERAPEGRMARAGKRRGNRGALPAHLPRIEVVVDIDNKICPCCQGELHRIGEDKSERLDLVPAQFRVLVTRRPKYACRSCEDGVMQAPAPARLIERGLPTEATVAQILVSKYADHLPLYRQAQIYARQGIELDRSTLADWVGHAAWHLRPLHERPDFVAALGHELRVLVETPRELHAGRTRFKQAGVRMFLQEAPCFKRAQQPVHSGQWRANVLCDLLRADRPPRPGDARQRVEDAVDDGGRFGGRIHD